MRRNFFNLNGHPLGDRGTDMLASQVDYAQLLANDTTAATNAFIGTYVHRLNNQRTIETRILGEVQASWRQAVTGKSFQLTQAGLWSAQVLQTEAQIAQIAQDIQTAQVALEDLLVAQTLAAARCGAVDKIVRSAECREQRFRDEKALDDFAYRATGVWRTA